MDFEAILDALRKLSFEILAATLDEKFFGNMQIIFRLPSALEAEIVSDRGIFACHLKTQKGLSEKRVPLVTAMQWDANQCSNGRKTEFDSADEMIAYLIAHESKLKLLGSNDIAKIQKMRR